jgi:predicted 3-demethylubiquinone-9 3-methyltransferase (glyoxalase superfamily)
MSTRRGEEGNRMPVTSRIAPCLWFEHQAEEAAQFQGKFGLSWQVVPTVLPEMLRDHGSPAAERAMRRCFA